MTKGIPTFHRGIRYRSRLEAKWATMFAELGWSFIYEPFDAAGYIPDFLIEGDKPLLVEIKPAVTAAEYQKHYDSTIAALGDTWHHDVLILGASPTPNLPHNWGGTLYSSAGMLAEHSDHEWIGCGFSQGAAIWSECPRSDHVVALTHDLMSFACRPCGHYEGGHVDPANLGVIRMAWADATNSTQWRPM